jgi:photosynthetic reaction center cytochrome c subunit
MNVPAQIWTADPAPPTVRGSMAGWRDGQNVAGVEAVAYASLPYDPFERYLGERMENLGNIRVASQTALPTGTNPQNIKTTEETYGLMMHLSDALGVNCTYCHNSRAFSSWEESLPARTIAWHGLHMVQDVNQEFLAPLASALPDNRKGVNGDAPKAHCGTCHQGVNKPLNGAPMLQDYPSLAKSG